MPKKILVAYATQTGSTAEVASEIGKDLSARGFEVELRSLAEVQDLADYEGFVIGAPVNGFRWRTDALEFVKAHRDLLGTKPTAYFLLSVMYGMGRPSARRKALSFLDEPSALVAPVKKGFFGGVMQGPPPVMLRLAFGIPRDAPRDGRDWEAIRAWAEELAPLFS